MTHRECLESLGGEGPMSTEFFSNEQLQLATEVSGIGCWDVVEGYGHLAWTPLVKEMFGISAETQTTMDDFYNGLHPEDLDRVAAAYAAAADPALRALYNVEYRTLGKEDRAIRWVAAKGRGIFDETGQCVRMIGTAIDITARMQLQEERLQRVREPARAQARLSDRQETTDPITRIPQKPTKSSSAPSWSYSSRSALPTLAETMSLQPGRCTLIPASQGRRPCQRKLKSNW